MLRRHKKRDEVFSSPNDVQQQSTSNSQAVPRSGSSGGMQHVPSSSTHPLYMQGSVPNSSSSSILGSRQHTQGTTQQAYEYSRSHKHIPSSTSVDTMMYVPHSQQSQQSQQIPSVNQGVIGRSQSTLNFLLSKARNPFTSNPPSSSTSQTHPMSNPSLNASSSLTSLYSSANQDEQNRNEGPLTRSRAMSSSSSVYLQGPVPIDRGSSPVEGHAPRHGGAPSSYGEDHSPLISPTKRGFFGRERKASHSSVTRNSERGTLVGSAVRPTFSPLGRSARQDSSSSYALFSKSQSDLHSRPDLSPPMMSSVDLPKSTTTSYGKNAGMFSSGDTSLLRSPNSNVNFSKSVDDLSRGQTPPPAVPSAVRGGIHRVPASEVGTLAQDWGRASDIGPIKASGRRPDWASSSMNPTPLASPLTSNAPTHKMGTPAIADQERRLPPGVDFEGFLNRNTNISLSIHQLTDAGTYHKSRDREKDIGKGWKPWKAVLRDGKLYFFKPPNTILDEVKGLFPSTVVQDASDEKIHDHERGLTAEDLLRNKVNTRDLLLTTSPSPAQASPSRVQKDRGDRLSAIADEGSISSSANWEQPGKHTDLEISDVKGEPPSWAERIKGGTLDSLCHEFVFATQATGNPSQDEAGVYFYSILLTLRRSQRPFQGFLLALQKWAVVATDPGEDSQNDIPDYVRTRSFQNSMRQRMCLATSYDVLYFVDESNRASILAIIQDMAKEFARVDTNDEAVLTDLQDDDQNSQASAAELARFDPHALLRLDPVKVAKQIHAFHTAQTSLLTKNPQVSVLRLVARHTIGYGVGLVAFDWEHPHFLTRVILDQILDDTPPNSPAPHSSPKSRAAVLRHWIAVASYLIRLQNVSGWLAICVALCSRAVARLATSWRLVAPSDRTLVGTHWVPILARLGWSEVHRPCVDALLDENASIRSSINAATSSLSRNSTLPYLGNSIVAATELESLHSSSAYLPVLEAQQASSQLWKLQQNITSNGKINSLRLIHDVDTDMQSMLSCIAATSAAQKDMASYLRLSLQIEPPSLGQIDLSWHPPLSLQMAACTLSPLVIREALPNLSLVDVNEIASLIRSDRNNSAHSGNRTGFHDLPSQLRSRTLDSDSTIVARGTNRPSIVGIPPSRSKSLSSSLPVRPQRGVPYGDIVEWTSGSSLQTGADENIIRIGPDLIFSTTMENALSTPSSPMASKRFSQEFSRGSRPVSLVSKRSSLPASERSSLIEPIVVPLQVAVKAATLERLVDILVMGVQHLTTGANEENIEKGIMMSRRQRLSMDLPAYRKAFLATYRTICTPTVLYDYLRKRLFASVNAGREMALPSQHRPSYPSWPRVEPLGAYMQQVDWEIVVKIRRGIIDVLSLWISSFPQDFLESNELYNGIHNLSQEFYKNSQQHVDDMDFDKTQLLLDEVIRQMRYSTMNSQIDRKVAKRTSRRVSVKTSITPGSQAAFNIDNASPHDLVEYLESVVKIFFDKIDERDLLQLYEIFQERSSRAGAWHVSQNPDVLTRHPDEIPQINNMYKLVELLQSSQTSQTLLQRLPGSIRDACAAQNLLRGWTAIQIIEQGIGVDRRQARICKLIDAVWICRARMCNSRMEEFSNSPLSPAFVFQEPTIGSFVESIIIGSLTSSESRIFTRAWQGVAYERESQYESLASLSPPREVSDRYRESTQRTGTPDVGWIMKCIAQAVTRVSDVIQGESTLIDFDKCRTVWSLIQSSLGSYKSSATDVSLVDLASNRLAVVQAALRNVAWERRAFKEENAREMASASPLPEDSLIFSRRGLRPLAEDLAVQQEKHQLDRNAFEYIVVQMRRSHRQVTGAVTDSQNFPSPRVAQSSSVGSAVNEKRTRRMTALFRGAVRPMGLMSTSSSERSSQDSPAHTQVELLELTPSQKCVSTINCGSGRLSVWNNTQRSFIFNFSPPEGGHILLQAPNLQELHEWIRAIEKASKDYAVHITNTPASAEMVKKGSNSSYTKATKAPIIPLYGTSIVELAHIEKRPIPLGIMNLLEQVEARGLREQGIYRISGAKSSIEALKQAFSKFPADTINLATGEFGDIHTIAGAIKQWFRDLPEPAIPYSHYHALMEAEQREDEEERLYAIRNIIWEFPKAHFELVKRISEHLSLVCDEGEHNLMAPHNIGLVFGTSLLNPPPGPASVAESFGNLGKAAHIVKILVTMHDWLFEAEQESENNDAEHPPETDENRDTKRLSQMEATKSVDDQEHMENPSSGMPSIVIEQSDDIVSNPSEGSDIGAGGNLTRDTNDAGNLKDANLQVLTEEDEDDSLVIKEDLTVDSHTSDSSMMRAVMDAASNSPKYPVSTLSEPRDEAAIKKARRRESIMPGRMSSLAILGDSQTNVQSDPSPESTVSTRKGIGAGRERVVESVYLDATDAIAVLQETLEEEEEEEEGEDEKEKEVEEVEVEGDDSGREDTHLNGGGHIQAKDS